MKVKFSKGAITCSRLAKWCGGVLPNEHGADLLIDGICTDSREADETTVFCALRGERVNGHDYIENALAAGCRCILCETSVPAIEQAQAVAVVVEDTELALAQFANSYGKLIPFHGVGVTGSVGKTTTKEMIASVLSVDHKTFKTAGNHNSLVGMPLSMLEIPADTQWAVLEMGMSGFGEIERLSNTAEPEIAVITNIGSSHMEMLGSRKNICRAKLEILSGLKNGGTLILNGDEPLLAGIGGKNYRTIYVSLERENCDFFAKNIRVENGYTQFDLVWEQGTVKDLQINVMGRHNVYGALFAFAVGVTSGMAVENVRAGLLNFATGGLRQEITPCGDMIFLEDCYNASPESMKAALEVLQTYCKQTARRGVAVLGDMLELGTQSCEMHRSIGALVARMNIDCLVALGSLGKQIAHGARRAGMDRVIELDLTDGASCEATADALCEYLQPCDAVLFKASRGMGFERVIGALKRRAEQ